MNTVYLFDIVELAFYYIFTIIVFQNNHTLVCESLSKN